MLSLNELVMIRNVGWNSVPDSVAAKPNIQKIDDLKNSGIIKIFVSVILWDTDSIIIGLAHITQDPFRGTLRPSSLHTAASSHMNLSLKHTSSLYTAASSHMNLKPKAHQLPLHLT